MKTTTNYDDEDDSNEPVLHLQIDAHTLVAHGDVLLAELLSQIDQN